MEDKWIPNHPGNKILFHTKYDEWEWGVSDLIDWRVNQWDRDKIFTIFHHFDAEAIIRIPLSRRQVEDRMVWMHCCNGKYPVKFGYRVAHMLAKDAISKEESSEQRTENRVWSQLWKLRVPNKIKIFGWRACLNILPSKVNLARRKILIDATFGVCQRFPETVSHAIWSYSAAQDVWASANARIQKCGGEFDEFLHLFQFMMSKLSLEELANFLNWKPPMGQLYKLNFDAAVFANGSGIGAVIRNAARDVMAALSVRGAAVNDNEEAKAGACRTALEFATNAGFSELIIEADNVTVMSVVSSLSPNWSRLGVIYDDVRCLAAGLRQVVFSSI
ncbi:uncharacterized protein LOC112011176 [Quercus suber]|uniref:uncharacterized protein LOC112011176 n=1 Tax=Quercus suber TaxID=58331 RepID=UPI0032DF98FC